MVRDTYLASQAARVLSPWFVAFILMMTLVAVAAVVALVVASTIAGPHLGHAAHLAQSLAHQGLAVFRPMDPCSGAAGSSC
jgi:hypothetical protein